MRQRNKGAEITDTRTWKGEWVCQPDETPPIPREVWEGLRWTGVLIFQGEKIRFWCHDWKWENGLLCLEGYLADTSETVQGQVMKKRFTLLPTFFTTAPYAIRPFTSDRRDSAK